jgi:hypothetical protein
LLKPFWPLLARIQAKIDEHTKRTSNQTY